MTAIRSVSATKHQFGTSLKERQKAVSLSKRKTNIRLCRALKHVTSGSVRINI